MLEKKIRIGQLYDFYGQLLTERQQELMVLYYYQDFSLGEIAERCKVSRQAVYDHLHRSEKILEEYEQKLQLLARTERMKRSIQEVKELVTSLECDPSKRQVILEVIDQLLDG